MTNSFDIDWKLKKSFEENFEIQNLVFFGPNFVLKNCGNFVILILKINSEILFFFNPFSWKICFRWFGKNFFSGILNFFSGISKFFSGISNFFFRNFGFFFRKFDFFQKFRKLISKIFLSNYFFQILNIKELIKFDLLTNFEPFRFSRIIFNWKTGEWSLWRP